MDKEFYYLDGKEQKGPFTIDELKRAKLKHDTLVWSEDFDNWKPAGEVDELKDALKKAPPPPPIIDNPNVINKAKAIEDSIETNVLVEDSNVKSWVTFKIWLLILGLIGIALATSFVIINNKKKKLKSEIYSKIDNILGGKTVILDGSISLTQGELKETNYGKQSKDKGDNPFSSFFTEWWEKEKMYTIYTASGGGFTIKKLTKQYDDGFDIETIYSGDMGYKKPSGRYIPAEYYTDAWGDRVKLSDGYYSNNYRLSVRECYREAFEYFTSEDKMSPGSYSPGKLIDITNFPDIRNEYYYMDNTQPKQYTSSSVFSSEWESSGDHGANINTDAWAVYYKTYGKHYVLTENDSAVNRDLKQLISISLGSLFLLSVIIFAAKPKYFRNLNLYGKRWKNIQFQEQIFFFEHTFFGKLTFTEIIGDKVFKGIIKFTDKGNTINLSYPNKELFYKITTLDTDKLSLTSIKDNVNISLVRIGAKDENPTNDQSQSKS